MIVKRYNTSRRKYHTYIEDFIFYLYYYVLNIINVYLNVLDNYIARIVRIYYLIRILENTYLKNTFYFSYN